MSSVADRPLLTIGIPNYGRTDDVLRLVDCLEAEIAAAGALADGLTVQVASNPAPHANPHPRLLKRAARLEWLDVHRHPKDIGGQANMVWLADHAPEAQYFWILCDDDLIVPGGLATVLRLLADHDPAWLFLPYYGAALDNKPRWGTGFSGQVKLHASPRELWLEHKEWLTFISSCIMRHDDLRRAVHEVETDNAYFALLWNFQAVRGEGVCVTAAEFVLRAGIEILWTEESGVYHTIMTLDFANLYGDGLCEWLTREEFAEGMDARFVASDWGLALWKRVPAEALRQYAVRFPHSHSLRTYLWAVCRDDAWAEGIAALDGIYRELGADAPALALVEQGEAAFEAGEALVAARSFLDATKLMPTLAIAWNDLAVVLHALEDESAAWAADTAVLVSPEDTDARLNRASILFAADRGDEAAADLAWVAGRDPANPWLAEIRASAGAPAAA